MARCRSCAAKMPRDVDIYAAATPRERSAEDAGRAPHTFHELSRLCREDTPAR